MLYPPSSKAMPLTAPARVWGGAEDAHGSAVCTIRHTRDDTMRAAMALHTSGSTFILAAGSAPHRGEVRGLRVFLVGASAGISQEPAYMHSMCVCVCFVTASQYECGIA